jgi:hypothetical protein
MAFILKIFKMMINFIQNKLKKAGGSKWER